MKTAAGKAASGVVWSTVSQGIRLGAQVGSLIALAHLLPASDFGLIAMASIVTGLASLFRDFGTTSAVIQRPALSTSMVDSVFSFNLVISLGLALLIAISSPLTARLFAQPRLVGVLGLLSLAFPLGSLGLVHQALLERTSEFRTVAMVEGAAAILGLSAALWGGWRGWGAYSLVAQTLTSAGANTVGFWMASGWRPKSRGSLAEIRGLMGFTGNLVGFNVFNYFARNADNMLVGRLLGATELGYYTMAYRLMLFPLQNISAVVGRALLPVFSQMQCDQERLGSAYVRATAAVTLVSAPIMVGLFVIRDVFIRAVLGDRWAPVAGLLAWLAPIGLIQSVGTTVGTLYLAMGRTDIMFRWGVLAGVVTVSAFAVGIHWGLTGLVLAYAIVSLFLFIPSLLIPYRMINIRLGAVLRILSPSIICALLMGIGLGLGVFLLRGSFLSAWTLLVVMVILGILTYGTMILFFQRSMIYGIWKIFMRK